jgi:hypothetical protein
MLSFLIKVVIEVHTEDSDDTLGRPSSLQQLQDLLEVGDVADGLGLTEEKDGFLSRRVGYEIERRLVKAVQVRTLRKKKKKKGHYHYYPFYEKGSDPSGCIGWILRHLATNHSSDEYVYNSKRRKRRKRQRHHRFCMKCVTGSFHSLFKVIKEPLKMYDIKRYVENHIKTQ